MPAEMLYIDVPPGDEALARSLGACWDAKGAWYVPPGVPTEPFYRWVRTDEAAPTSLASLTALFTNPPTDPEGPPEIDDLFGPSMTMVRTVMAVERTHSPVDRPAMTFERPTLPVERTQSPVERIDPPVDRPAPPVERIDPPVDRPAPALERIDSPVDRPAPAVERTAMPVHVVGMTKRCYSCGKETRVIAGVLVDNPESDQQAEARTLANSARKVPKFRLVPLPEVVGQLAEHLDDVWYQRFGVGRLTERQMDERYRWTNEAPRLSNGCFRCDAMLKEGPIASGFEDAIGPYREFEPFIIATIELRTDALSEA